MPVRRFSNWAKVRIIKRPHPGYQFAKQPTWKQLESVQPIYINAGNKKEFDYTDCIENPSPFGTYTIAEASDIDGAPLDSHLSGVVVIQDESQPIVSVDASNVNVYSTIYFRIVHTIPNRWTYLSIWTSLEIRESK